MKNKTRGINILLIAFAVVTTVLFVIPFAFTTAFWISYAFTIIAFAAQLLIWNIGFKNGESLKSKFLGIPIVHIGTIYLIIQVISCIIFRFAPVQDWISIIVSVLILGNSCIFMISSQLARDEVNRVEKKVKAKVDFIRSIQCDVELLANSETDAETKQKLVVLAEKIRFSDPMSDEQLKPIEDKISEKLSEFKSSSSKMAVIGEIESLFTERNLKTKNAKQRRSKYETVNL